MTIFMHTGTSQASVQNYKNATVIACLFWTALMVAAGQTIYRLDSGFVRLVRPKVVTAVDFLLQVKRTSLQVMRTSPSLLGAHNEIERPTTGTSLV